MSSSSAFGSPIPLAEIESVLAWVDTFKLSRPTKKINRDFSDAVLLAEMLCVHYPKLVEMHNYPPRNSHSLKLNNWMTLNRKVLKKLKLNLCCNTMEQLANSTPGVIERVLVMVRDKIRRDDELNKTTKDAEQNVSSGGSYYEACGGDDEAILVVPLKTRVNGVLETIQQKVVCHDSYLAIKEELKDAKDTSDLLKRKVDHLDSLLKLKDERIDDLQKQLERKQLRRKEAEPVPNDLELPLDASIPPTPHVADILPMNLLSKSQSLKNMESSSKLTKPEESKIPKPEESKIVKPEESKIPRPEESKIPKPEQSKAIKPEEFKIAKLEEFKIPEFKPKKSEESKIPLPKSEATSCKATPKVSVTEISITANKSEEATNEIDRIKSDVFKEAEVTEDKNPDGFQDTEEFKDSEQDGVVTIEETIQNEIRDLTKPTDNTSNVTYLN